MAASSKLWNRCTCYEIGHCWNPSCLGATLDIAKASVKYSFRVYVAFYLISALVRRRGWAYFKKNLPEEVLQSTAFLTTNAFLFMNNICRYRQIVGGFYPWFGFISTFPACVVAILIERKNRRGVLALYVMNLAVEVVFNMLVQRGHVTPINNGEVLLFAVSSAMLFLLFRLGNILRRDADSALKLLVGPSELPPSIQESSQDRAASQSLPGPAQDTPTFTQFLPKMLQQVITNLVNRLKAYPKHCQCLHEFSCAYYSTEVFARRFSLGYTVQAIVNLLRALPRVFSNPGNLVKALYHKDNFSLGLFLGCYAGIFRGMSCILRWVRNKDNPVHAVIAGFLAGLSAFFYKSKAISLYVALKLAESVVFKLQDLRYLPIIPHGDVLLYSTATSLLLQAAVFEPHTIRPAYWRFLLGLTGNNFAKMNRKLLDEYGTFASKLNPDYWPEYDHRYTPNILAEGLL